jgi:hypothetical protein
LSHSKTTAPCPAKNDRSRKIFSSASAMVVIIIDKKPHIAFSVTAIPATAATTVAHKQRKFQLLLHLMAVAKEPHPNEFL